MRLYSLSIDLPIQTIQAAPQCLAIMACAEFRVYGVMRKVPQCVSGYVIGRYVSEEN